MRAKTTIILRWIAVLPVAGTISLLVDIIIRFIGHIVDFPQLGTVLVCAILASVILISVGNRIAPSHKFATALVLTVLNAVFMAGLVVEVIFVRYMGNESDYSSLPMPLWQEIVRAITSVAATIYCCNKVHKQQRSKSSILTNRKAAELGDAGTQRYLTLICPPPRFSEVPRLGRQ